MKKKITFLSLLFTFFIVSCSSNLEDILMAVEATTYNELGVPNIVWLNQFDASGSVGYDVTGKTTNFQGTMGVRVFDNLKVSASVSVDTDFASDTDYKFGLGMQYNFSSQNTGSQRFIEAKKTSMLRKIEVVKLYFDYFSLKASMGTLTQTENVSLKFNNNLDEVEIAYLLTQMEAYSSIQDLEPYFEFDYGYIPQKLDSDLVDLAILNYFELNSEKEYSEDGIYAFLKTDNEKLRNMFSGGIGGSFRFDTPPTETMPDRIKEIDIRRMKLRHDVICQNIPVLLEEIDNLKREKNTLTKDYVQGKVDKEQIENLNNYIIKLENEYFDYVIESYQTFYLFKVMRGDF